LATTSGLLTVILLKSDSDEIKVKTILVDIIYLKADCSVDYQQQLHGIIRHADVSEEIMKNLADVYEGQQWNMPTDRSSISSAARRTYSLRSTGQSNAK